MKNIETLVFDLDNTLYAPDIGLLENVRDRITEYIITRLGVSREEADFIRENYWKQYGITLSGLVELKGVDPDDFDAFVYDIDYAAKIKKDQRLIEILSGMDKRKIVYTNAGRRHAGIVLELLGIKDCFDQVVAIEDLDFLAKPRVESFEKFIEKTSINPQTSLFFEDSTANLNTAMNLGFKTALVGAENDSFHASFENIYELESEVYFT